MEWSGERTLADIQREFPQWTAKRGADGLYHADPPMGHPGEHVRGEDPQDLRDMIIREIWRSTGECFEAR